MQLVVIYLAVNEVVFEEWKQLSGVIHGRQTGIVLLSILHFVFASLTELYYSLALK